MLVSAHRVTFIIIIVIVDNDTRANIIYSIGLFAPTCLQFVAREPANMNVPYMRFRTPIQSPKYVNLF